MTQDQKLERWAEKELLRNIGTMIVDDDHGGIVAFGKYYIHSIDYVFQVNTWDREIHNFSTKRIAMSWCTADKYQQYNLANTILVLDRKKQTLAADIYCRKTLGEHGKSESFYEIINIKIQPKMDQYNSVSNELEKCVNRAKYIQIRGFNNETARTIGPYAK
jgi:hypothetical protein